MSADTGSSAASISSGAMSSQSSGSSESTAAAAATAAVSTSQTAAASQTATGAAASASRPALSVTGSGTTSAGGSAAATAVQHDHSITSGRKLRTRKAAGGSASAEEGPPSKEAKVSPPNHAFVLGNKNLQHCAKNAVAMLGEIEKAKIEGVHLFKGELPDKNRVEDPKREYHDLDALLKDKKHKSLHDNLTALKKQTEAEFRVQLKALHVVETDLHMVVFKLLVTEPGAEAQEVHMDVVKDPHKCWGVLLYCTDAPSSTCVPATEGDLELLRKLTKAAGEPFTCEELKRADDLKKAVESNFKSKPVTAGDALFFQADVAHYGPALKDNETQRVILYALFSKDKSHTQDKKQLQPLSKVVIKEHLDHLLPELKKKQQEHQSEFDKAWELAHEKDVSFKQCSNDVKQILALIDSMQ